MISFKFREKEIIRQLLSSPNMTGQQLAEMFDVSTRTIRNDIAKINDLFESTDISIQNTKNGYCLHLNNDSKSFLLETLDSMESNDFGDPINREKLILARLLKDNQVDLYHLADELYISESTVINDIRKISQDLIEVDPQFTIHFSKNIISIDHQKEEKIRKNFASILKKFYCINSVFKETFEQKNLNIHLLYDGIVDALTLNEINLSQTDFSYLSKYICLSLFRQKYSDKIAKQSKSLAYPRFVESLKGVLSKYSLSLNSNELIIIDDLLSSFNQLDKSQEIINLIDIIEPVLKEIDVLFASEFNADENLKNNLQSHLLSMIKKQIHLIPTHYDLGEDLEKMYPFSHSVATYFVSKIQDQPLFKNINFSNSETLLITIYFELSMEHSKLDSVVRLMIVSDRGPAATKLLETQIKVKYPNFQVLMVVSPSTYERLELQNIDLVISTVPKSQLYPNPYVISIGIPISADDFYEINQFIESNYFWKKTVYDQIIHTSPKIKTSDDVLQLLEEKVSQIEGVNLSVKKILLEREQILSTYIGNNVAMPHGLVDSPLTYSLYIFYSEKGIYWQQKSVHWIVCILINKRARKHLNNYIRLVNGLYQVKDNKQLNVTTFAQLLNELEEEDNEIWKRFYPIIGRG